jgi:hypothetical protein
MLLFYKKNNDLVIQTFHKASTKNVFSRKASLFKAYTLKY